jgi:hypothetical protein
MTEITPPQDLLNPELEELQEIILYSFPLIGINVENYKPQKLYRPKREGISFIGQTTKDFGPIKKDQGINGVIDEENVTIEYYDFNKNEDGEYKFKILIQPPLVIPVKEKI